MQLAGDRSPARVHRESYHQAAMAPGRGAGAPAAAPPTSLSCWLPLAALIMALGTPPAAGAWPSAAGFVENVGQVAGDCLYYRDSPDYRLEVHPTAIWIWLKDQETYPRPAAADPGAFTRREEASSPASPPVARLTGTCLRLPLAGTRGRATIVPSEPTGPPMWVFKGSRHCRHARAFTTLTVSVGLAEALRLHARPDGVSFERTATAGEKRDAGLPPWVVAAPTAGTEGAPWRRPQAVRARYLPIDAGRISGYVIEAGIGAGESLAAEHSPKLLSSPELQWSTFVGGESEDFTTDLAVGPDGSVVVAGDTYSATYPTTEGTYDRQYSDGFYFDGVVSKLSADGSQLLWSTYLGGMNQEELRGLALTVNGEVVVTGYSRSADYPTTPGAYQEEIRGEPPGSGEVFDIFVTRLSAAGDSLVWSTFLGGTSSDWAHCVTEGIAGEVILGGRTASFDFPTTLGVLQPVHVGEPESVDAILAALSSDGTTLQWATYLGGSQSYFDDDEVMDLVVMSGGSLVVYGQTYCQDFPVTSIAYQRQLKGLADMFVCRVAGDGSALLWSTFLGGTDYEFGMDMALTPSGGIILSGSTQSDDFPTTLGAYDRYTGRNRAGFVTQLASDGTRLLWSTLLGGIYRANGSWGENFVWAVDVDAEGTVWAGGYTDCADFPVTPDAYDATFTGTWLYDSMVLALAPNGRSCVWASYLGGASDEVIRALRCDGDGRLVLGLSVWSADYPVTAGSYDVSHNSPWVASDVAVTVFRTRPVPVLLQSFTAARQAGRALVAWQMADVEGAQAFEVWRGANAGTRELVGVVPAHASLAYEFVDNAPPAQASEYWLRAVLESGGELWFGPAVLTAAVPPRLELTGAAPNPFNPRTTIRFALPRDGQARLAVYDQRGRLVRTVVDAPLAAGYQSAEWDGLNDHGAPMPSGVYLARLESDAGVRTMKVTLAK